MNKFIITLSLALALMPATTVPPIGDAYSQTSAADNTIGQQQVERLWADFAKPDLSALDQFVAPGFQSLHEDGARDWAQERQLVAELKLTPYVLSDYKVTRNGDVLLVTYQCKVGETIAAARLAKESTPRMDVFQQTDGGWKLLSHVNVRKISPQPSTNANPMMIAGSRE
jgi:hypothetical protein